MAISNLSTKEMIGLSGAWVDPTRSRKVLADSRRTSHLLDDLDSVHEALLQEKAGAEQPSREVAELLAQQSKQDEIHDQKARGASLVLSGLAELASTAEQQAVINAAIQALFPEGLGFINTSYTAEAGNTEATEQRLSKAPQAVALLKGVQLPWGSLHDEVQAWLAAGHALGKLETQRLRAENVAAPAANPRARARNRWLAVVSTMVANIAIDASPAPALETEILAPLREAEARADARSTRKKKGEDSPTEPGNS